MQKIPSFFKPVFWSYDFKTLDADKDKRLVIVNTINYGSWQHWLWILKNYDRGRIKEIIENTPLTAFRPGALKLISVLIGIRKPKYASRDAYIRE